MRSLLVPALVASACLLGSGCGGGGNYARSAYGTEGGFSLKNAKPKPASLMVARKSAVPLYLLLDPAKIKDTWPMETPECEVQGPGCERFSLFDVHQFVERDLRSALDTYFDHVEVVSAVPSDAPEPHLAADVKIDTIDLHSMPTGALVYTHIQMKWGIAFRRNDEADYAYSFAGVASSSESYRTFEAGCAQMIEDAIQSLTKKLVQDGGLRQLLSRPEAAVAPATVSLR